MNLISFSVKNFRSISTAYKLSLNDYTVIVGPNNEGKSNILKALGLALTLLTDEKARIKYPSFSLFSKRGIEKFDYNWERDFPINLQSTSLTGRSEFICEFELDAKEFLEFKKKTKINLTTNLKAKISIGKEHDLKFDFLMKGKGCLSPLKDWTKIVNQFSLITFREHEKTKTTI